MLPADLPRVEKEMSTESLNYHNVAFRTLKLHTLMLNVMEDFNWS